MSINDFLALSDDQIDYTSLDVGVLWELATQNSEPYIATSALAELGARGLPEARSATKAILAAEPWDRYLRAFAITTLCNFDRDEATQIMERLLDGTDDSKGLEAMVECVLSDPEHFSTGAGRTFAERLAVRVAAAQPDDATDLDERSAFLSRYGTSEM